MLPSYSHNHQDQCFDQNGNDIGVLTVPASAGNDEAGKKGAGQEKEHPERNDPGISPILQGDPFREQRRMAGDVGG